MFPQQHFKLSRQAILLAMISAAYPVTGYCVAAGRADFVIGEVTAVAPNGIQRALTKGATINAGDAINTAAGARAQIRFADGGFVSLQPNTQFRVDEYQYDNQTDGKEKGFFSLLKGGLRAITGAIGRVNRNTYQVATPSATIGIRGTGYNATQGDGLLVNVGEGAISLTNNAGELVVTAGGSAFVADFNTLPKSTFDKPLTPPAGFLAPLPDATFIGGNVPTLYSGPNYSMAIAGFAGGNGSSSDFGLFALVSTGVTATFTGTSQLTQYDGAEGGALGTAHVSFSATDGIIGWGRWNGGLTDDQGNCCGVHPLELANGDTFHYIVGIPTSSADMYALNSANVTATYSLIGGTRPTGDGAEGGLGTLNSGSMTVNFGLGTGTGNLQISFPTAGTYNINGFGVWASGATFTGNGMATGGYCGSGCSTSISGFFAGANAARAGVAYSFQDYSAAGNVAGVAAFTKSSSVSNPPL
jgi:hypothetical protein